MINKKFWVLPVYTIKVLYNLLAVYLVEVVGIDLLLVFGTFVIERLQV